MSITPRSRFLVPLGVASALVAGLAVAVPGAPTAAAAPAPASVAASSDDPGDVWTEVDEQPEARRGGLERRVDPSSYAAYHLDLSSLSRRLDRAPRESAGAAPLRIEVPAPNGDLVEFAVSESPVMEPALAAAHPDISTWSGHTTGDATPATIRLDVTPMGFHASVRGPGASWYVDPAYNGPDQGADALYLSYLGDDLPERDQRLIEPEHSDLAAPARRAAADPRVGEGNGAVAIQRTYRLALVTDPSYATYFALPDGTVSDAVVTAEKVTLMNRVNQVYGDDLSIRMLLVGNNDLLNFNTAAQFTGANGRCGNVACYTAADIGCGDVIDTNRFVVGQIIGADKFDIGHIVFGPDGDGGGVAYFGVGEEVKAGGCTGLNPPTGDGFAIDYVAHEMGHQFYGNHTFNGNTGSCAGGNRNDGTAVEPGSGTSVMAYAGICGVDNLQPHSDPYFSQRSQQEIAAHTRGAPYNVQEIANVALSGFTTTGESFSISYGGPTTSTVTVGTNYTAAGLKAALEAAEPSGATATVVGSKGTTFGTGANGFQVTWSGNADIPTPTITVVSGDFRAIVGTYDNGGPTTNQGFDNPTPTGNRNPSVTAPAAKTIPIRTPFELTGSATDADAGDQARLVYLWEQNDAGTGTVLSSNTKLTGPLFRIFGTYANVTPAGTQQYDSPGLNLAGTSPTRSFPDAAQVAAGTTNAATGNCPTVTGTATIPPGGTLDCYSEYLPKLARTLSFRLTARDLSGADGGTAFADTTLTVGLAGPFAVTSQPTATPVAGGGTGTVAWNVASTNTATYATNVRIRFSTDGGLTFPTTLVESTPNDGSEDITWPNVATSKGRIRVEAVGNYFYDVNDGDVTITPTAPPAILTVGGTADGATFTAASSDPLDSPATITAESNRVAGSAITATPTGLPTGLSLTRGETADGATTFEVTGTADDDPGTYPVSVVVSDGEGNADDKTVPFTITVDKDDATLTYTGDTAGPTGTVTLRATVADTDATPGTVEGTVAFTDQTTGDALCSATVTDGVAACPIDAPATRTYRVVATLASTRYTGSSEPATVVVTEPDPGDTTPPETTVASGPAQSATVLTGSVTYGFASSEEGSSFACTLNGREVGCADGTITVGDLASGTYDLYAAATDAAGNTDATPVRRRFYVPVDDTRLPIVKGSWKRVTQAGYFRSTYASATRATSTLSYSVKDATSLALVLSNARAFGAVDVYLGSEKLVTINAKGTPRKLRVAAIDTFTSPRSGTLRIVSRSDAEVRIDGLVVRTAGYTPLPAPNRADGLAGS